MIVQDLREHADAQRDILAGLFLFWLIGNFDQEPKRGLQPPQDALTKLTHSSG
jgi:hypothetical protein